MFSCVSEKSLVCTYVESHIDRRYVDLERPQKALSVNKFKKHISKLIMTILHYSM